MRQKFQVSYDEQQDGDIKGMLAKLKKEVQEYSRWSLGAMGGFLLGSACREELKRRGRKPPQAQSKGQESGTDI
jgi:hypothetical protein